MSRFEAWAIHLSTLLVGGTGLVYAWLRYVATPADPYAVAHPLQPAAQHLHLLAAPLLVFAAGLIWREHVWAHFQRGVRARRRSGLGLLLTLVPMVASGYLLQAAVEPAWRSVWVGVHLGASGLWLAAYLGHLAVAVRGRWRDRAPRGATPAPVSEVAASR